MRVQLKTNTAADPVEVRLERAEGSNAAQSYRATIGGDRPIDLAIETDPANPSSGVLKQHGETTPFHSIRRNQNIDVWIDGRVYTFELVDQTARRIAAKKGAGAAFETLTAPMPGTILKINIKPGDSFDAHAALIVMESMKMEMTLSAPAAGRVKEIACRVGQLVEMGQLLARMEAPNGD